MLSRMCLISNTFESSGGAEGSATLHDKRSPNDIPSDRCAGPTAEWCHGFAVLGVQKGRRSVVCARGRRRERKRERGSRGGVESKNADRSVSTIVWTKERKKTRREREPRESGINYAPSSMSQIPTCLSGCASPMRVPWSIMRAEKAADSNSKRSCQRRYHHEVRSPR